MFEQAALIGIAAWRVSALFSYERGPFDIFLRLRERLNVTHDDGGRPIAWPDGFLSSLINCIWCLGLWATAIMFGLWYVRQEIVIVLAASSILIAVEKWNNHDG